MNQWIKISEKLPDNGKVVLLILKSGKMSTGEIRQYAGGKVSATRGGMTANLEDITHWMELPPPPTIE